MKRVFLDTNILIDYIDNRVGADDAEQIFACGFSGEILLYASSLTFANMACSQGSSPWLFSLSSK